MPTPHTAQSAVSAVAPGPDAVPGWHTVSWHTHAWAKASLEYWPAVHSVHSVDEVAPAGDPWPDLHVVCAHDMCQPLAANLPAGHSVHGQVGAGGLPGANRPAAQTVHSVLEALDTFPLEHEGHDSRSSSECLPAGHAVHTWSRESSVSAWQAADWYLPPGHSLAAEHSWQAPQPWSSSPSTCWHLGLPGIARFGGRGAAAPPPAGIWAFLALPASETGRGETIEDMRGQTRVDHAPVAGTGRGSITNPGRVALAELERIGTLLHAAIVLGPLPAFALRETLVRRGLARCKVLVNALHPAELRRRAVHRSGTRLGKHQADQKQQHRPPTASRPPVRSDEVDTSSGSHDILPKTKSTACGSIAYCKAGRAV